MILNHFPSKIFSFVLQKHGWSQDHSINHMYICILKYVQSSQFRFFFFFNSPFLNIVQWFQIYFLKNKKKTIVVLMKIQSSLKWFMINFFIPFKYLKSQNAIKNNSDDGKVKWQILELIIEIFIPHFHMLLLKEEFWNWMWQKDLRTRWRWIKVFEKEKRKEKKKKFQTHQNK